MSIIETMIDIPAEHEKNVCGQFDSYLKKIERTLACDHGIQRWGDQGHWTGGQCQKGKKCI